mmetsp:Transcript_11331/g.26096  ORF Transcript_11331/g.26096 Transcript_11331/m.26096 type:complete len:108 (+) Transcript_11331:88-411(+)
MVYYQDFDEFRTRAKDLFMKAPLRTRYLAKYRNCDQKMVLKVTDDRVCLKFRTGQASDIKRIEKFSQLFARWAATQNPDDITEQDAELEEALQTNVAKPKDTKKRRK